MLKEIIIGIVVVFILVAVYFLLRNPAYQPKSGKTENEFPEKSLKKKGAKK